MFDQLQYKNDFDPRSEDTYATVVKGQLRLCMYTTKTTTRTFPASDFFKVVFSLFNFCRVEVCLSDQ